MTGPHEKAATDSMTETTTQKARYIGVDGITAAVILWPIQFLIEAVLWVLGWPVCGALLAFRQVEYREVPTFDRKLLEWTPSYSYLWGNDEDGIDGLRGDLVSNGSWREKTARWPCWLRILVWSAWRNPTGNLRFIPPFGFIIDPARVRSVSGLRGYFCQHGLYTGGALYVGSHKILIGWNLRPEDRQGVTDYRAKGCGFKFQPWSLR